MGVKTLRATLFIVFFFRSDGKLSSFIPHGQSNQRQGTLSWLFLKKVEDEVRPFPFLLKTQIDRRTAFASVCVPVVTLSSSEIAKADDIDGISIVTRSSIGTSVRKSAVKGAQLVDKVDEKWERLSDSFRDKNKCDPVTNRRLFDNGFRKDGTRIGNPVLGALCDPVPLLPLNNAVAKLVLAASDDAILTTNRNLNRSALDQKVKEVNELVGPSFLRAVDGMDDTSIQKNVKERQLYNQFVYASMRAYSQLNTNLSSNSFEVLWGDRLLFDNNPLISPDLANRNSFTSPFPPLSEDDKGELDYDEGALLDALGTLSAALQSLQDGGLIGHWEISIPVDDYGEVVTIAVDDDISLGAQSLLKQQKIEPPGSVVTAIVKSAFNKMKVACSIDAFFIDPSTTKQEIYEPTQLLLNLSNIKRIP